VSGATEYKLGYIILHYQAVEETFNCVSSIKQIKAPYDIIIIVDNSSPDASGVLLKKKYAGTGVDVILNERNEGFARGNNTGYAKAKYEYHCDFIIMLNNDTLIKQEGFREKVIASYEKHHFAVMGPRVLNSHGEDSGCSPIHLIHTSRRRAKIGQLSNYLRYFLSVFDLDTVFGRLVDRNGSRGIRTEEYQEDVQVSGCCLVCSKEYINRFEGLNPETFMYLEEAILYVRVRKAGIKIIYDPEVEIVHLGDMATLEMFHGEERKARQFKYRCQMDSFKALIQEMDTPISR